MPSTPTGTQFSAEVPNDIGEPAFSSGRGSSTDTDSGVDEASVTSSHPFQARDVLEDINELVGEAHDDAPVFRNLCGSSNGEFMSFLRTVH